MDMKSPIKRAVLVILIGILDSAYLLYHHVAVVGGYLRQPSLCNLGGVFDCDKIAESAWAEVFGVPVASYGLLYYLFFVMFIWIFRPISVEGDTAPKSEQWLDALLVLSISSLPATLWFIYVSLFEVNYICLFCSLLYLVNVVLCAVFWWTCSGSASLVKRIENGLCFATRSLVPSFTKIRKGDAISRAFAFWLLLGSWAMLLYAAPGVLEKYIFEPREVELRSPAHLKKYYIRWKQQRQKDITVLEGDAGFKRDYWMGADDAPVTLVVFSDFRCPFCRKTAHVLNSVENELAKKVRIVFKNYPIDASCNDAVHYSSHALSCQAAVMVRCAGRQDKKMFWKMHDTLFALTYLEWDVERLFLLPEEIGLKRDAFDECLQNEEELERVREDISLANRLGVNATPTIYINGKKLVVDGNFRIDQIPGLLSMIVDEETGAVVR